MLNKKGEKQRKFTIQTQYISTTHARTLQLAPPTGPCYTLQAQALPAPVSHIPVLEFRTPRCAAVCSTASSRFGTRGGAHIPHTLTPPHASPP